jgi:hypothetical protein
MSRVILHIGTLKTGTTSFQKWFSDNEEAITAATGVRWFRSDFPDAREIAAACIDDDRETPAMALGFFPARGSDEWLAWRAEVERNVRLQVDAAESPIFVSCEALCLLRTATELARLANLFPADSTEIVLTIRRADGFLGSWKQHLEHDFFRRSNDPRSFAYVANDSWLVDYNGLIAAYKAVFTGKFTTIDYDTALTRDGSVLPALIESFTAVPTANLPDWRNYRLNRSARPPRKPVRGLARPRHYVRYYKWKAVQSVRHGLHRLRNS